MTTAGPAPAAAPVDPNGLAHVTRRLTALLEHPQVQGSATYTQILRRLHQRDFASVEALRFEIDRIASLLDLDV